MLRPDASQAESEGIPRALFDQLPESVTVCSTDGRVRYLNPTTGRLLGVRPEEAQGRLLWELAPEAKGSPFREAFERVARTGHAETLELFHQAWQRWVSNRFVRAEHHLWVIATDTTEQRRIEQADRMEAKRLHLLERVSRAISTQRGLSAVLESIASAVVGDLSDSCVLYLLDEAREALAAPVVAHVRPAAAQLLRQMLRDAPLRLGEAMTGRVVQSGRSERVPEVDFPALLAATRPEHRAYMEAFPFHTALCVPLRSADGVIGAIGVSRLAAGAPFSPEDEQVLQEVADRACLCVQNARLHESEQRAGARVRLLAEVSETFARTKLELQEVLDAVCREVTRRLSDSCAVNLISPSTRMLELAALHHHRPEIAAHIRKTLAMAPVPVGVGPLGAVAQTGEPLLLPVVQALPPPTDISEEHRAHLERFPIKSLLIVPLRVSQEILGTLTISRDVDDTPYTLEDQRLLQDLADRGALAIARAQRYQELRAERQRLSAVLQQMPSAVALVEAPSGKLLLANPQHERSAFSARQALHPDGRPLAPQEWPLERSLREGAVIRGEELQIVRGDGSHAFIRVNSAPVRDEQGQTVAGVVTYDDVTAQKEMLEAVRRGQEQLRLVTDALPVLVASIGTDLRYRFANSTYERWFGRAPKEVLGMTLAEVLGEEAFNALRPEVERALGGTPTTFEAWVPYHSGGTRFVRASYIPQRDEHGQVEAFVALVADITQERRAREEREALLRLEREARDRMAAAAVENARLFKEAQEAVAVRDDFLSVAGHELRTPLTALSLQLATAVRLLEGGAPALEVLPRAEKAARNLRRFSGLVNELLDISRISAGRLTLERSTFELSEAVQEVLERSSEELLRAGCQLQFNASGSTLGTWDRVRIEQVVTNLLSNAIKYGKAQPIEVSVAASEGLARLSVRDFGIGISQEDQQRIFQRFERAVSSRHFGGLGLGLWVSRQLVEAHGGSIRVTSTPEQSALFCIELPLSPAAELPAGEA